LPVTAAQLYQNLLHHELVGDIGRRCAKALCCESVIPDHLFCNPVPEAETVREQQGMHSEEQRLGRRSCVLQGRFACFQVLKEPGQIDLRHIDHDGAVENLVADGVSGFIHVDGAGDVEITGQRQRGRNDGSGRSFDRDSA
jgi:hypothetical protein